ncbi:MAG TPA: magnesium transporter CorA family protein [Candidatus Sulfomarinibacteraceae bacterium]|nr:magnesium transporter CorA family protein [Candidatus Sulfomarinibacteraceae bacterium]
MTGSAAGSADAGRISVAAIRDGTVQEWTEGAALEALEGGLLRGAADRPADAVWIDLAAPSPSLVERVAKALGLHPLIAEDIIEGNQRSKIEGTDGLVHLVLFALEYADDLRSHEVDLVLGDGFLLSSHPASWDPRAGAHFRTGLAPIMGSGADHLLWAICDSIVDAYFPFADRVEDTIDALQDDVMEQADRTTLTRLFTLKRELIAVRRAVSPVREVLNQLTNRELAFIDADEVIYFRDIYDHVIRLTDELDTDRELVTATLDVYLSQVNNNLSAIMKRLTGVTVLLAGIGAIAGIFGMSEAGHAFSGGEAAGFWVVAIVTVMMSALAALALRRAGWI